MVGKTSFAIPILTLFLLLPASSQAQQWSDEEQEVLDHLVECWDIWMEGIKSGSPERWISECSTPALTYWVPNNGAPSYDNAENLRRNWGTFSEDDLGWVDIRPVSLTVIDDIAVLHFYGSWRIRTAEGETVNEAKRTEVFRRIDGRWKMIAGHSTPVTQ